MERISGESLPLGCFGEKSIKSQYRKLYDGDMIILLSDGMLSFEGREGMGKSMEELLAEIDSCNAQAFAHRLMELIPEGPEANNDDRTVLVAVIYEKGSKAHVE